MVSAAWVTCFGEKNEVLYQRLREKNEGCQTGYPVGYEGVFCSQGTQCRHRTLEGMGVAGVDNMLWGIHQLQMLLFF